MAASSNLKVPPTEAGAVPLVWLPSKKAPYNQWPAVSRSAPELTELVVKWAIPGLAPPTGLIAALVNEILLKFDIVPSVFRAIFENVPEILGEAQFAVNDEFPDNVPTFELLSYLKYPSRPPIYVADQLVSLSKNDDTENEDISIA